MAIFSKPFISAACYLLESKQQYSDVAAAAAAIFFSVKNVSIPKVIQYFELIFFSNTWAGFHRARI